MMNEEIERILEKQIKVRDELTNILTTNFEIDNDIGEMIATDAIQATLQIKRISTKRKVYHFFSKHRRSILTGIGILTSIPILYYLGRILLTIVLVVFVAIGSFCSAHCGVYPITSHIVESKRFADQQISNGGYNESLLCLHPMNSTNGCLYPKKIDEVNSKLDEAVNKDFNGVVWEGANGNGEYWKIERNNYRFVITRTKDENFK